MSTRTISAPSRRSAIAESPASTARVERATRSTTPDHDLALLLLDEARQGMALVDQNMVIQFTNRAFTKLFPSALCGHAITTATSDVPAELVAVVTQAISTSLRSMVQLRIPARHGDGGDAVYRLEASPISPKKRHACLLMVEDVTEQSQTEQIRKDFVTNASHELRTPLALIHGYIETLQSGMFKGTASMQRCLEVMDKHSRRMMRIIEDMLTISRLEGSDGQLRFEPFHVRGCVEDVLEHLTPLIDLRQPQIRIQIPAHGVIHGDRFYWDQIFTNLLENALKENSLPGLVLTIGGEWTDSHVILSVSDNGVGIPAEDIPFVFKRFFRCVKHHSQEVKGTGLGLSIVKRAIEAHGGQVSVRSTPGVETTFTMTLPNKPADES
jgi:two-component system, OmpR family, phosphate regulon sensor histidine kinase PhoR